MRNYLFAFIATIFLSGCSSLSLSTDYDKKIDFSNFNTYRWHANNEHNEASLKYLNPIMDQRIRSTIDQKLQTQGYTKASTSINPVDFLVNYSIVIEDRADIRTYNNYNGMYPGYAYRGGYGYYGGMGYSSVSNTQVTHYKQGTLIIDIINPETDKLIWRGAADGRLPNDTNRNEQDALVQKYVTRILAEFPPKDSQH
ncbi:MAG: DUF4136 domain-containing protein [Methyloprofundus sp.]|nr:DUF4136 domain-containing protein [Methyloprofundus sp.]